MCDPVLADLLEQFSKAAVSTEPCGVSFRGRGLKLDNKEAAKEVVEAIRNTPDMTYLDLEGNTLGVEAAEAIGEALRDRSLLTRALWKDMFTGRMKTEIPKALKHLGEGLTAAGAQLIELDLSDNAFGPIGVEALADLLKSKVCYKLQELRLNNNGLGITGGKLLAAAIIDGHHNSVKAGQPLALKVFIAGRNRLENDGATALSQVFKALGSLEEVAMPQNGIYHKGISMVSDALQYNVNLRVLNLNDNTLTARGATCLAAALPALQKLQTLNLGDCLLKTKGAEILADALAKEHQQLEEVVLDSNEIRITGGLAVARALKNKKQLKKISLVGNEFGGNGRALLKSEAINLHLGEVIECPSDEDASASEGEEPSDSENSEEESGEQSSEDENESSIVTSQCKNDDRSIDATILQFLLEPTQDNFMKLADKDVNAIVDSFKLPDDKMDVETCVKLIMKLSNLSCSKSESIRSKCEELTVTLYKEMFRWAEDQQQLSEVNNILFVYLQLIKAEDNALKVSWDVDRCVGVLQSAIQKKIIPQFTQHILTCCLDRKSTKNNNSLSMQPITL